MEPKIVITEPSAKLRAIGRSVLSGHWKEAVLAFLIYQIILDLPVAIIDTLLGYPKIIYGEVVETSFVSLLYIFIISGIFSLGIAMFFLTLNRKHEIQTLDIFNGFEFAFKAIGLAFMVGLFVFLWALLLIVPGIIAAIRYSQAFFILADNPEKGIMDCISESKMLMEGNKAKFFCLIISFIGWAIVASIPSIIFSSIVQLYPFYIDNIFIRIVNFMSVIPYFWVYAYVYTTLGHFFEMLRGKPAIDASYTVVEN